jgi:hypothetical protein
MITLPLHLFRLFPLLCGGHRQFALENLASRQPARRVQEDDDPARCGAGFFVWAERLGGQEQDGWVLYRIVNDSSHE